MTSMLAPLKLKGIEMTKKERCIEIYTVTTSLEKRLTKSEDGAGLSKWLVERTSFRQQRVEIMVS